MSGRILLVDDVDINLRLLEARLHAEYYETVMARSGAEALAICANEEIDLVLLDVMMPGLDGYEVCRRLKRDPRTAHLPVVLITALDGSENRVAGLEAGADDFLTKPVRDLPLLSRLRSLLRLKQTTDELRRRTSTATSLSLGVRLTSPARPPERVGAYASRLTDLRRLEFALGSNSRLSGTNDPAEFCERASTEEWDLAIVDLARVPEGFDAMRLVSHLRVGRATRHLPILVIIPEEDEALASKALELGAGDYLSRPIDTNEFTARVRTQINRAEYEKRLRQSLDATLELALFDSLTGLHNRRFLQSHLEQAVQDGLRSGSSSALLLCDLDHFKRINDGFGHDAGDEVLKEFAARLKGAVRAKDLACRYGGEEFVVLMRDTDEEAALAIAERVRQAAADTPFEIAGEPLRVTTSVGFAFQRPAEAGRDWMKRADAALYHAKWLGRNCVATVPRSPQEPVSGLRGA